MTTERLTTRAWAEIDLAAIRHNFECSKAHAARYGAKALAVMKANAYGHGAKRVALELERFCGADLFAVATLDEALELSEGGISSDILVLSEVHRTLFSELCEHSHIITSLFRLESARELSRQALASGRIMRYYLVVDTGMSRIGFECSTPEKRTASLREISELVALPGIECAGIFSHYACADMSDKTSALAQKRLFDGFVAELAELGIRPPIRSMCNTAALLEDAFVDKGDLVRAGIGIYGLKPSDEVTGSLGLIPAMSIKARVTDVKVLPAGVGVSYGHTFVTSRETTVATVACGYADGYPRLLSGKAGVLINGSLAPILGRVCMDQMMVDVTGISGVEIDSIATLLGGSGELCADSLAAQIGTIGYELICAVSPRIPRIYVGGLSRK